jgi:hypothetical protein
MFEVIIVGAVIGDAIAAKIELVGDIWSRTWSGIESRDQ